MVDQKILLNRYVEAVLSAPEPLHLTATREPGEFWQRHVLDALKLLEFVPLPLQKRPSKVLDVGSGNGIPGIPIAIAAPDWHVTLLDSNSKKSGFLDVFCKSNELKNLVVLAGRAEKLAHDSHREAYDIVFARALGKLPAALELASPFLKVGGMLIVPHGTSWEKELKEAKRAMSELNVYLREAQHYNLGTPVKFSALIFEKTSPTPENYPRAIGKPTKRPL